MTLAAWLTAAALGAGVAYGATWLHPRLRDARRQTLLLRAHAALLIAALLVLLAQFVLSDLSVSYVWAHTDASYPIAYRIAGLWGGEEGTVLLWAALVAAFALVVHRDARADAVRIRAAGLLVGASTALALVNVATRAFDATDAAQLALAPGGRGLADVLLTPLMVIHPPVQFVAYALVAPVAALAFASWTLPQDAQRERAWVAAAWPWARAAWLFATLGLGLGALWAYYVLSFGGYWAWDPVETSNLLPWLALTAFMHAGKQHAKFGDHRVSAPFLAVLAFALTLFATFATRSGWWVSVHAFTDPTNRFEPDAPARLLAILDAHMPTRMFIGYALATLLGASALFAARHLPRGRLVAALLVVAAAVAAFDPAWLLGVAFAAGSAIGKPAIGAGALLALLAGAPFLFAYLREDAPKRRRGMLDPRALMTAAVALISLALVVAFLLNLQVVNGPDRVLFDQRAPFLALPIVSLVTVMMARASLGERGAVALAAVGAVAGVVAWFAFPAARVLALAAPLLLAAVVATALKLAHVQGRAAPRVAQAAGVALLVAGFLAIFLWSNPVSAVPDALAPYAAGAGVVAGVVALLGAVAAFRARWFGVAFAGALAATIATGVGVVALALLLVARRAFAHPQATQRARGRGFLRAEAARIRETGIYAIHLALVVGLIGVAASTYNAERETLAAVVPGSEVMIGAHALVVGEPVVRFDEAGRVLEVIVPLTLDGNEARSAVFGWSGAPSHHYKGILDVARAPHEDVYVSPLAFRLPEGWVSANGPAMAQLDASAAPHVEAVSLSVSVLPLMSLVWGGLWGMIAGMTLALAGGTMATRDASVRHAAATAHAGDEDPAAA